MIRLVFLLPILFLHLSSPDVAEAGGRFRIMRPRQQHHVRQHRLSHRSYSSYRSYSSHYSYQRSYQPSPSVVVVQEPSPVVVVERPAPVVVANHAQPTSQPAPFVETDRDYHRHGKDADTVNWIEGLEYGRPVKIWYDRFGREKKRKYIELDD